MRRKNGYRIYFASLLILVSLASCNPNGQNVDLLYRVDDYPAGDLVWSSTGRYLAFTSQSGSLNKSSIYILDINTKEAEVFMTSEYGHLEAKAWKPDETELVFYANSSDEFSDGIWIVPVNNSSAPRLYLDEEIAFGWSFTNQIAIGRKDQAGNRSIYLKNLSTEEEKTIFLNLEGSIGTFSWSADGKTLAFSLDPGEFRRRDILVVDLETREVQQTTNNGANYYPSLSPSGNMVAYRKGDFSGTTPTYPLYIMNSDGTCDTGVPGLTDIGSLAWSPDGNWIAFVGKGNRIFLLDVMMAFGQDFLVKGISCN